VPLEVHLNSFNYLAVFEDPQVVRTLRPDMNAIAHIEREGVIVTPPETLPTTSQAATSPRRKAFPRTR
jgi:hypothetical protein